MASAASGPGRVYHTALESYLISMARTVEGSVNRSLEALLSGDERAASDIFLTEPRINEMEIIIDDHAVRLLGAGNSSENEVRHIVATLKINNDLERMGDLAVNISQRVVALAQLPRSDTPAELEPMSVSVRAMVGRCLGALIYRNVTLANQVLASEEAVDNFRDQVFNRLLAAMKQDASRVAANIQFLLATRHLERIADHATNIAEDVVFWLRGLDIRHGRISNWHPPDPPDEPGQGM
ncbi:MAG TPA: phosphate signaling complex protein PhoU [Candidatus Acidoferrales bacterium]|nr:phosphate signaling complex protein PhoU [Candidatus Acidoferrales bacterium]